MPCTHSAIIPRDKSLDLVRFSYSTINSAALYCLPPNRTIACNAFIYGYIWTHLLFHKIDKPLSCFYKRKPAGPHKKGETRTEDYMF